MRGHYRACPGFLQGFVMTGYARILIFKPGAIGDLLHLTPVIRALKERWPAAAITLVLGSPVTASMFAANPLLDRVVIYDQRGAHRRPAAFLRLWRELRRERFDLVINYQRSNLKGWLLLSAAFPARCLVYQKAKGGMIHAVTNHLETLQPLGIDPSSVEMRLDFPVKGEDEAYADAFIRQSGLGNVPLVAFNPGTSSQVKCWPAERFAQLGDRLMAAGAAVVIVGSHDERELVEKIAAAMAKRPLLAAGCTLPQLAALLRKSCLLVTGDTGPMHVAAAVGTRVVALFGSMDPARSGPVGPGHVLVRNRSLPCVPCGSHKSCGHTPFRECMDTITVDEVYSAVRSILAEHSAKRSGAAAEVPNHCGGLAA